MSGKEIQRQIYDWLLERYPEGPDWMDPNFDACSNVPIEIKMISAFDELEYNISNGGWAQFLWNCNGCWRQLIDIAHEGYLLIGALEQASALHELRVLCERDATEAEAELASEDGSLEHASNFTRRSYAKGPDWERLFWSDSGVYERRLAWLEQNEFRVRQIIGRFDA
jgi:hypothetical protein